MVTQGHEDAPAGRQQPSGARTGSGAATWDPGKGFPRRSRCLILLCVGDREPQREWGCCRCREHVQLRDVGSCPAGAMSHAGSPATGLPQWASWRDGGHSAPCSHHGAGEGGGSLPPHRAVTPFPEEHGAGRCVRPRGYKYTRRFAVLWVPHVEALLAFVTPTLSRRVAREGSGCLYLCQQTRLVRSQRHQRALRLSRLPLGQV